MPSLHIDFSANQDLVHLERGIPVYARELVKAMLEAENGWDVKLVLNAREPIPEIISGPVFSRHLLLSNTVDAISGADVFLDLSPFYRAGLPPYTISKNYVKRGYLAHDLIPFVFPDKYFPDELTQVRHRAKLERLRHADFILANSEHTKSDVESLVPFAPPIYSVGTGVAEEFRQPIPKARVRKVLNQEVPGIIGDFILYTGGSDWRKNIEGLVEAYSSLPEDQIHRYQLVVVCEMNEGRKSQLRELAQKFGVEMNVLFTGKVSQNALRSLYQSCALFVFPSHYEGFGLPVAEALLSGARVVCANNSNLPSLVPDRRSLFDSHSVSSMTRTIAEALQGGAGYSTDDSGIYDWQTVAQAAWSAIETSLNR